MWKCCDLKIGKMRNGKKLKLPDSFISSSRLCCHQSLDLSERHRTGGERGVCVCGRCCYENVAGWLG